VSYLENYEIVPEAERALHKQKASMITDPAKRREIKIKQYQKEKDLRARIEVCIMVNIIFSSINIHITGGQETQGSTSSPFR
jgi:hypothetical protein